MTEATIGLGTVLQYGDGESPEEFTPVAEVVNITGPSMSRELPDATHMASPGGYREFLGGLKDGGQVACQCNHLPNNATQDALTGVLSFFNSGVIKTWQLVFPTSPAVTWEFQAVLENFEPETPIDDKMGMSFTLKVSGQPSFLGA